MDAPRCLVIFLIAVVLAGFDDCDDIDDVALIDRFEPPQHPIITSYFSRDH